MRGLFDYDGPLTRFFGKVGDCVILSALWLAFSLPVITLPGLRRYMGELLGSLSLQF